jgi:hypothetical protein
MAIRRLQGGEQRFVLTVKRGLDRQVASGAIARFHRDRVSDAQTGNRRLVGNEADLREITTVDGKRGAPLESVNPDGGTIVTILPFAIQEILAYIDALLVIRSPVGPTNKGAPGPPYQRVHRLFADGAEIDPLNPPTDAREYIFVNNRPYARKIERGQGSAPDDGVYEGAAAMASKKFGTFAYIRFSFQAILEGGIQDYSDVALGGRKGGKNASAEKRAAYDRHNEQRYPAIRVRLRR